MNKSAITLFLKPHFKKVFGFDKTLIGIFYADKINDTLTTEGFGTFKGNQKPVQITHDKILSLKANADNVSWFMDDIDEQFKTLGLTLKEIHKCRLKFDFVNGKLTNQVNYVNAENKKETVLLTTEF